MPESMAPLRRGAAARLAGALASAASWRVALPALAFAWVAVLVLYRGTAAEMVGIWLRSDTFAHAILVPPVVAWLVFRQRKVLATMVPAAAPGVLVPLGLAALLWLLGELSATNAVSQFALVAMLALTVPAVAGLAVARRLAFPLGFLFFAVPMGDFLLPTMMAWTADFTVAALRATGIPVYREGLQFIIPSGHWSVVEACSGVRYLIASLMVGVLYAYLNYRSLRRRLAFVAAAIAVPIVANWVRAYLIVLLGHLSDNRLAAGVDHLIYGWIFFGIVIVLMFLVGRRWADADVDTPQPVQHAIVPAAGVPRTPWFAAAAVMLIAVVPHAAEHGIVAAERVAPPRLDALSIESWRPSDTPVADWTPAFSPSASLHHRYAAPDGRVVGLYIGYYRSQGRDHKLVGSGSALVRIGDERWRQLSSGRAAAPAIDDAVDVRTAVLAGGPLGEERRLRVWQLYWVNGTWTASDVQAKLYGVWHRLRGRGDDAAVVVLHAGGDDPRQADALLGGFLHENLAAIETHLRATRDAR